MLLDWNVVQHLYLIIGDGGNSVFKGQCLQNTKNDMLIHVIQPITLHEARFTNQHMLTAIMFSPLISCTIVVPLPSHFCTSTCLFPSYDVLENRLV